MSRASLEKLILLTRSHFFFNSGFECCSGRAVFNCSGRRFQASGPLYVIEVLPRLKLYRYVRDEYLRQAKAKQI